MPCQKAKCDFALSGRNFTSAIMIEHTFLLLNPSKMPQNASLSRP
jgi:hypothetical protein